MNKKDIKFLTIATAVAVSIMVILTVYDIAMVGEILPITGVLWTKAECAFSVATAWPMFVLMWPLFIVGLIPENTIEEMTK